MTQIISGCVKIIRNHESDFTSDNGQQIIEHSSLSVKVAGNSLQNALNDAFLKVCFDHMMS